MPKASPIHSAFNVGEVSPLLYGRVDQDWYKGALKECLRYIPLVQGPVTRCPGTKFVAEVKDSSRATRAVRFEFSTTQAYIIEFGNQYFRFYKDNAQITLTAQNISGITQANPAVVTYAGADTYANGDRIVITGVLGMTQVNNREFTVANVNAGANTFELSGVDSTAYGAYASAGTVAEIYEISTPYLEADLFQLKLTQSNDTLYITHPTYARRKLTRSGHASWTLSVLTDRSDGPYLAVNTTATTLTPSAATGTGVTLTASAITGINNNTGFQTTDVGRVIRLKEGSVWGYVYITARNSTTEVVVDVQQTLTSTAAKAEWRLGLWSDTTGHPAAAAFYEDRLWFGTGQRIDGSKTGDYEEFPPSQLDGTVIDSYAVSYALNSDTVNAIRWMVGDEKGLIVGTAGGEWLVRPSSLVAALTPTNVKAAPSTNRGSANIQAVRVGESIMFVQRIARKLRELAYSINKDGLISPDRTVRASHITKAGMKELAYQAEPLSIVWIPDNDGTLLGFTFEPEQQVTGWHKHVLGGAFGSGQAVVESAAVIPASDGTRDELWLIAKFTINGGTKRLMLYMGAVFEEGDDIDDAFFVDAGLTYNGAPATSITGLFHLEGQTVSVLGDGAVIADKTVSGGAITLPYACSKVHVGLGYTSRVGLLRQDAGAADGTSQGKLKRIMRVVFRFLASVGLDIGPSATGQMDSIQFRDASMDTNDAIPPFSGDKKADWPGDHDREGYIVFRQSQPLPSTIVAVMPQLETQDDG